MKKIIKGIMSIEAVVGRQRPLLEGNSIEVLLLGDTYYLLQLRIIFFRII